MWCRQCQQDVPVLRGSVGGPACPRCRTSLAPNAEGGVELASFDPPPAPRVTRIQPWVLEADAFELRRLERKLRPCLRHDPACATPALELAEPAIEEEPVVELEHTEHADHFGGADTEPITERALRGGAASVAADSGFLAMIAGAATMAAQNEGLIAAEFWRWGVIGTGIGGAVFALGILRLATRAWRQGRALEAEIDALQNQVAQLTASAKTIDRAPLSPGLRPGVAPPTAMELRAGRTAQNPRPEAGAERRAAFRSRVG
jgi:hypothetical protein